MKDWRAIVFLAVLGQRRRSWTCGGLDDAPTPCIMSVSAAPMSAASKPAPTPDPLDAPPPAGLDRKRHLRADDYARKNQGGYVTGLPLANYDPTTGVGFGGRLYYYFNGHRDDPLFAYTPYEHRIIVQAFGTTRGAQDHLIDYDAPNFLHTLYRVRATLEFEAANIWPYYGDGTRTLSPLAFPGAPGKTFSTLSDYNSALSGVQRGGQTYALYNSIGFQRPTLQLGLERLLLGGILRPLVGVGLAYDHLSDFTGQETTATGLNGASVQAREAQTLFAADCAARRILGCGGGWDNVIRLALSLDTRDFEPDPNDGVYAELSERDRHEGARLPVRVRPRDALGSRLLQPDSKARRSRHRRPWPLRSTVVGDAVLLPGVAAVHRRQPRGPRRLPNAAWLRSGSLRRTHHHAHELRATVDVRQRFHLLKQGFGLMVVPFLDLGRIFDNVPQTTFGGWKRGEGAGFRIAWNEATILMADFGVSTEGTALYLNFNHIF